MELAKLNENTTANSTNNPPTQNQTVNVNELPPEEQAKYYKDLFNKSKTLVKRMENEMKKIKETNKNLNEKLKEYEAGM
jgi:hypothetical protein